MYAALASPNPVLQCRLSSWDSFWRACDECLILIAKSAKLPTGFSTTFRLGCGGGLILAGEGVPDEISISGSTSMGSGPGCVQGPEGFPGSPGLVPLGAA